MGSAATSQTAMSSSQLRADGDPGESHEPAGPSTTLKGKPNQRLPGTQEPNRVRDDDAHPRNYGT